MYRNSTYVLSKLNDPENLAAKQQIGVDLTVAKIEEILIQEDSSTPGLTKEKSKLQGISYKEAPKREDIYLLKANTSYAVTFDQGLKKLSDEEMALITQRSSLNRAGVRCQGSIYDGGFTTIDDNGVDSGLGATLYTSHLDFEIPLHSRIAQITIQTCELTDNSYRGQWQGKANK